MSLKGACKAACLGATAMYYFDPQHGAYRRSLISDKFTSLTNSQSQGLDVATRDFGNRLQGMAADMRSLRNLNEPVPDDRLAARIRSKLGRYSSHPRAIEVDVADGQVTLSGPILANEVEAIVDLVRGMAGVQKVENNLTVHQSSEGVPALQGGRPKMGEPVDLLQSNWSPSTKLLLGVGGAAFFLTGSLKAALAATGMGAVGLGMAANGMLSGLQSAQNAGQSGGPQSGGQQSGGQQSAGSSMQGGITMGERMSESAFPSDRTSGFNTMQQPSLAANPTETGTSGEL
jgi:hypothetical protein